MWSLNSDITETLKSRPAWECSESPHQLFGESTMSKEQKSNKENKKKPALSPKEKKAVKKSKKDAKS